MFNKMPENVPTLIIQGNFSVGNSNTLKTHTQTHISQQSSLNRLHHRNDTGIGWNQLTAAGGSQDHHFHQMSPHITS